MTIIPTHSCSGELNEITLSTEAGTQRAPTKYYDYIIAISVYSISSQPPSVGIVCPVTQILTPTVQLSFYTGDSQVPLSRHDTETQTPDTACPLNSPHWSSYISASSPPIHLSTSIARSRLWPHPFPLGPLLQPKLLIPGC